MAIYEKPTKTLMRDFVSEEISVGQVFKKEDAVRWFHKHYPKIKPTTVRMHVEGMSVNSRSRIHHRNVKPGSGHDLFLKLGPNQYRLWEGEKDPAPIYREAAPVEDPTSRPGISAEEDVEEEPEAGKEFAFERDLRNYLSRNLSLIEPGLQVYEEEEISGIEFPVGGRFIDILAVDRDDGFVVIELKVSRGYDRVVGHLLRYMGWIEKNLAEGRKVRGVIVASHITEDLKLASMRVSDIQLVEYEISFSIHRVEVSQ